MAFPRTSLGLVPAQQPRGSWCAHVVAQGSSSSVPVSITSRGLDVEITWHHVCHSLNPVRIDAKGVSRRGECKLGRRKACGMGDHIAAIFGEYHLPHLLKRGSPAKYGRLRSQRLQEHLVPLSPLACSLPSHEGLGSPFSPPFLAETPALAFEHAGLRP